MITLDDNGRSVEVSDTTTPTLSSVELERWGRLVLDTLAAEGVERGHVDLLFIDASEMASLNQEHMGGDGPTDVLSFPMDEPGATGSDVDAALDPVPIHLGDVLICSEVACRQAPEHAGSVEVEYALLVIHGVLHVLGHDHAEPAETAAMQARERVHLQTLGFEHPAVLS